MAGDYVWFVPQEYAVAFEASGPAEAWAHVQKHKKRWSQSYDLPSGRSVVFSGYETDHSWFENWPKRTLGAPWPPGIVKQTPSGTLYTYRPNNPPPAFVGREKWTLIQTDGRKDWVEIDDGSPGYRRMRNSERQHVEETLDDSNARRAALARDGWQRVRVK